MDVGGHEVNARQQHDCWLLTVLQHAYLYILRCLLARHGGGPYVWPRSAICFHSVLLARTQLRLKCSKRRNSRCEQQSDTRFGAMYRNGKHAFTSDVQRHGFLAVYAVQSGCDTFVFETCKKNRPLRPSPFHSWNCRLAPTHFCTKPFPNHTL